MRARGEARDRALHAELESLKQELATQSHAWQAKLAMLTEGALAPGVGVVGVQRRSEEAPAFGLRCCEVGLWLRQEVQGRRQLVAGVWAGFAVLVSLLVSVLVLLLRRC
jgi:hypothetical protein